jgi:23S rRNA pseudouridine2604 synthase
VSESHDLDNALRLNKRISDTGLCSRREADALIVAGRVSVNGVIAQLGDTLSADDLVAVDGEPLRERPRANKPNARQHVYIALNKPVGITCTTDTSIKGNIVDFVGHEQRIFPIGRLDKDSEGLILLTSNGDIVNEILRAENRHEKEYLVGVNHAVTPEFLTWHGARRADPRASHTALPYTQDRQVRFRDHPDARPQPADSFDGRGLRLSCQSTASRAHRQHQARRLKPGQWRNLTDVELRGLLPGRTKF